MIDRLPAWIVLLLALVLMGIGLLPVMRVVVGVDETFQVQFFTVVMLLTGGLMCGLTAMILMVRRQSLLIPDSEPQEGDSRAALKLHASGLLLYSGVPLANFLAAYWLWLQHRRHSGWLDSVGIEVLNFQIAVYLYLLIALLMTIAIIGVLAVPLILMFHFTFTLMGMANALQGKHFRYPGNIPIIQGRREATS